MVFKHGGGKNASFIRSTWLIWTGTHKKEKLYSKPADRLASFACASFGERYKDLEKFVYIDFFAVLWRDLHLQLAHLNGHLRCRQWQAQSPS